MSGTIQEITADHIKQKTAVVLDNTITPAVSANQANWNPTGLAKANQIIIDNTGVNNDFSGITAPSPAVRKTIKIYVKGSGNVRWLNNNVGSTAANRILCGGTISQSADDEGIEVTYDTDVSRWRMTQQ